MDPAYISALAALAGSVIGGLTSLAASGRSQNVQARTQLLLKDKERREELYRAFIEEASELYASSWICDKPDIPHLVRLFSMVHRMQILSSPAVFTSADALAKSIVDASFQPKKTLNDLRDAITRNSIDPLGKFSTAVRREFR